MKSLITLIIMSTCSISFAGTRHCPSNITFQAGGIKSELISGNSLKASLSLIESTYTKCSYRGTDKNGDYASASIQHASARGSKVAGTLYINFEKLNITTVTKLKTISKSKLEINYSAYRGVRRVVATTVIGSNGKVLAVTKHHSVKVR